MGDNKKISSNGSICCKGFIEHYPWFRRWLPWKVERGNVVRIGIEPYVGGEECYLLGVSLINFLSESGYKNMAHSKKPFDVDLVPTQWLSLVDLGLQGDMFHTCWN